MLRLSNFIVCAVAFILVSCVQGDYDLSKGLNTTVSIGGDSLALPIGRSQKILLSSVLKNVDMLYASNNEYSIVRKDSLLVKMDALKPISFSIVSPVISSVEMNFADVKLPNFQISDIPLSSPLPIPDVDVSKSILPIDMTQTYSYPITDANSSSVKKRVKTNRLPKSTQYVLNPILMVDSGKVEQSLTLDEYPLQAKRVNTIMLTNNRVKIVFDWSQILGLKLITKFQSIQNFKIDFPSEYRISSPEGDGAKIVGNSFIIQDAVVEPGITTSTYYLKVDNLDLSQSLQNGSLDFKKEIPYKVEFAYQGETNDLPSLKDRSIDLRVDITSSPIISDLSVETNQINVADDVGFYTIHKQITTVPHEISYVSQLYFKEGAYLQIQIDKPDIAPFTFVSGYCEIKLPSMFKFKRNLYLNTTTNVYRLPYNKLFGIHKLPLLGAVVNQAYPEDGGEIFVDDQISYKVVDFKLSPVNILSSQVSKMNNKQYNFKFSTNLVTIEDADMITREVNTKIPDQRTALNVKKYISDEVEKLYSASMAKLVKTTLHLDVEGLPSSIDSLFFRNYTIKLPSFLKYVDGTTNYKNEIILNRGFKVSEGFTKVFELEKLDFGTNGVTLDKGVLSLNDSITMSGSVYVKGVNVKSSDIGTVKVKPSVSIDDISLGLITGKFNPNIAPMKQVVPLNLPSFLMDDSVKLDVSNPVVMVKAGNAIGIPIDVDVTMTPKRKGVELSDAIINTTLSIDPAQSIGERTWTNFWLATATDGVSEGYKLQLLPNLSNLLKKIPDEIVVDMKPKVTSDHHQVDLTAQNNQLEVKYDVHIPLTFGSDFQLSYKDTISDLKSQLNKLLEYSSSLSLFADVENNIPLELKMEVTPLDIAKKKIDGITISTVPKIKSGNADGSSQTTKIGVDVTETVAGALKRIDAFLITVSANRNSTIAGLPLREDQYFLIDLKVLLPNGLSVDLRK